MFPFGLLRLIASAMPVSQATNMFAAPQNPLGVGPLDAVAAAPPAVNAAAATSATAASRARAHLIFSTSLPKHLIRGELTRSAPWREYVNRRIFRRVPWR